MKRKTLFIIVSLLIPFPAFCQYTAADELRNLQNEMRILRDQQEMESQRIAGELRRIRQIEEEKLRDAQRIQKEEERAEMARKIQEHYAMLHQSATSMETQIRQGQSLSQDQLEWIRAAGRYLKARMEDPHTLMLKGMIGETEQGFSGVSGTLPMSKAEANAAKQKILRDESLFQRYAAISRANTELGGNQELSPPPSRQDLNLIVPRPIPQHLRPKQTANNVVDARKRALMQKMNR